MRYRTMLLATMVGLGTASCGETPEPTGNAAAGPLTPAPVVAAPAPVSAPQPAAGRLASLPPGMVDRLNPAPVAAPALPEVVPPADARWTLLCYVVPGTNHIEDAKDLKAALIKKTRRNDWYVIHARDTSTIYFGFYKAINATETKDLSEIDRARKDHEIVKSTELLMEGPSGRSLEKPFANCAFVQLSAPDPTARPEWNLAAIDADKDAKDPTRAYWSLQVMAFRDNPLRKEAAMQAVASLREKGVAAYYYHGESISSVCIGVWPATAVKAQASNGGWAKELSHPGQALLVTAEPFPDSAIPKSIGGQEVVAVSPTLEIVDKTLLDAIKKYPEHAVNYDVRMHTDKKTGQQIPDPSFLVPIPRPHDDSPLAGDVLPPPGGRGQAAPAMVNPTVPDGGASRRQGSTGLPSLRNPAADSIIAPPPGDGQLRRVGQ